MYLENLTFHIPWQVPGLCRFQRPSPLFSKVTFKGPRIEPKHYLFLMFASHKL